MCARIGLVSGHGLASVLRRHYPTWVVWSACLLLLGANTVNIAADLGGMADALTLLTGVRSIWFHCFFAVAIVVLLVFSSYRAMARVFKWLILVLLAYVGAAMLAQPRWYDVLRATVVPSFSLDRAHLMIVVAILGTTISPYLFSWQAAQEVEDRTTSATRAPSRPAALASALGAARRDTVLGMFFSNAIAFFIMLTTGATLFAAGGRDILSAQDVNGRWLNGLEFMTAIVMSAAAIAVLAAW